MFKCLISGGCNCRLREKDEEQVDSAQIKPEDYLPDYILKLLLEILCICFGVIRFVPGRHILVLRFVPGGHDLVQTFVPGGRVLVLRFVPGRHHLVLRFVPGRHRLVLRFVPARQVLVLTITRHFQKN